MLRDAQMVCDKEVLCLSPSDKNGNMMCVICVTYCVTTQVITISGSLIQFSLSLCLERVFCDRVRIQHDIRRVLFLTIMIRLLLHFYKSLKVIVQSYIIYGRKVLNVFIYFRKGTG